MNPTIFQLPFVQVALPLLIGIFLAVQVNNKRMDDMRTDWSHRFDEMRNDFNRRFDEINRRFDEIIKRLDRIEVKLDDHGNRIVRLEAETSPLANR